MSHLLIDIKNCYGIGRMTSDIELKDENPVAIVYAPNGTMKTSLTRIFQQILAGKAPCDDIYTDRESSYSITIDGTSIDKSNTYVFANTDLDATKQISTFLANAQLRQQYEDIYQQLDKSKKTLTKRIKNLAQSSDCEKEILAAFRTSDDDNFFDCLVLIGQQLDAGEEALEYDFRFNDMFEEEGPIRDFISDNHATIVLYFNKYQELLSHSRLYSTGPQSFGTGQATTLLKSVSDNRFFLANHKFELGDGQVISSKSEMEQIIKEEKEAIITDPEITKLFETFEEKLQKNTGLRGFKDVIQSYPELIPELLDYDRFQQKILRGYLSRCRVELHEVTTLYLSKRDELKDIISHAQHDVSQWEQVVNLFNTRFFVPFTLELQNKSDILLSSKTAELIFKYSDGGEQPVAKERKTLIEHLSTGEQKAFFILQNIFELEARKAKGQQTLLVFDDVADSFDYKNKYAIIEYLHDLSQTGMFKMLILTHNFDFYRTVCSRLRPCYAPFAYKDETTREVELKSGIYKTDILKNRLLKRLSDKRSFIASIPFVRNLIEYTEGDSTDKYHTLTACLHVKDTTPFITMADIMAVFQGSVQAAKTASITFGAENYLTALFAEADAIMRDPNEIDLVNKLVLSMAIRIKAEQYMRSVLTAEELSTVKDNNNLTSNLVGVFKQHYAAGLPEECRLMNRVLMLTSENIHINNFMFEPLVEISILHIKQLYAEIKALQSPEA